jgi:hypothetical protein
MKVNRRYQKLFIGTGLAIAVAPASSALAAVVTLDFETPGQVSNNFFSYQAGGMVSPVAIEQTGFGAANDFARTAPQGTGVSAVAIVDPSPGNRSNLDSRYIATATPKVFSGDFAASTGGINGGNRPSVGFTIIDPTNISNNLLLLVNFDVGGTGGTGDRIRIFRDGASNTQAGAGTSLYDSNTTVLNGVGGSVGSVNLGINLSSDATPVFGNLSFGYSVVSGVALMTLQFGSTTFTSSGLAGLTAAETIGTYELGVRLFDNTNAGFSATGRLDAAKMDNFTFDAIPEPAAFISAGVAGWVLTRRRRPV